MATTSERRRAVRSEDTGSELRSDDNAALAALLDSVDCGVLLFGARGELRAANDRFAEILHLAPARLREFANFEELAGHLAQQFSDPEGVAMHWRKRFEATEGTLDELELVHPEHKMLERITRPVRGPLGERRGWIEIYRDIGSRSSIHADRMVALGRLVSGVAHELNNPLTSILGFAQLMLRRGGGPERDTGAQQILSEVERASRIVRNLLLFARETEPERARVNLNDIVKSTLALRAHELRQRRISVRLDLDAHLPPTAADAMRLQQVLLNLLGNAEQAIESQPRQNRKPGSPNGPINQDGPIRPVGPIGPIGPIGRIWVRTRQLSPQRVVLEVIDDGPGIPSEIVARIFDPFFTTKPPGMGTGLGLSIVFGIVQDHGGRISVENRRAGGAAFRIELPIGAAPETLDRVGATGAVHGRLNADRPNDSSLAASPHRESLAMPVGAQERILVVEDEPTVARLIADILDEEGYVVHTVLDSLAALDLICAQEYALVICDLRMPRLDGRGFYRELVRRHSSLQTRIVFVTGDTLTPHASHFLKQSGAAFLAKPFLVEELKNAVAHALATGRNPEVDSVATPVQARRPR
jgi:two-component system, NtrC family, sensor kinase